MWRVWGGFGRQEGGREEEEEEERFERFGGRVSCCGFWGGGMTGTVFVES